MRLDPEFVHQLIFGTRGRHVGERRFTQDSPVLPDVWQAYGESPSEPVDLLLTPHIRAAAGAVGRELRDRLDRVRLVGESVESGRPKSAARVAYNQFHVVASLYFDEAVRLVLPMTGWWREHIAPRRRDFVDGLSNAEKRAAFAGHLERAYLGRVADTEIAPELLWIANLAGTLSWAQTRSQDGEAPVEGRIATLGDPITFEHIARAIRDLLRDAVEADFG
ncbi:MAG: hypothetical protein AAGE94_10255, partial [Acidobacteriota bacterium]